MSCVLLVSKDKIAEPMEWFSDVMKINHEWVKNEQLNGYNNGSIYFSVSDNFYRFEDWNNEYFTYWDLDEWLTLAQDNEIIYGYYSEDDLSAEFIHICNSECIREYREYFDDEDSNIDNGDTPAFDSWVDVSAYVDMKMS